MACLPQITGGRLFNARTAEQIIASVEEALRLAGERGCGRRSATAAVGAVRPGRQAPSAAADPRRWAAGALSARPARGGDRAGEPAAALDRLRRGRSPRAILFAAPRGEPLCSGGARPLRGRGARRARLRQPDRGCRRQGADGGQSGPQRRHPAGQGPGAEERRAARRCRRRRQRRGPGRRRQEGRRRPPGRHVQGQRGPRCCCPPAAISCASSRAWCAPSGPSSCRPAARDGSRFRSTPRALLVSAAGHDGSASAERVVFSVVEDDPDAPKGRREVARSAARQADFVLAARHLLRGRAAGQRGGARAPGRRPGDVVQAHAQRRPRAVLRWRPSLRRRAGAGRAGLLPRGAPRRRCAGGDHDQPRRPPCWFCRAAAIASRAATGP